MNLRQVFNSLEQLHLSGLAISNNGAGIADIDKPVILNAINQVLTELYGRFNLKTSEVIVRLIEDQYEYLIHSAYADSNNNSTEPVRWVVDSIDNPFKDDIQYITAITDSLGEELPLNKSNHCNSVFTPSFNLIQVDSDLLKKANALSVIYRANHEAVPTTTYLDVDTITLGLPQNMFNVLILGVCMYVYSVKGGKEGFNKAMSYSSQYQAELNRLEQLGVYNLIPSTDNLFEEGGWA